MQKPNHIYWFAPYDLSCPSTRYRAKYPLEYLHSELRITYDLVHPDRSIPGLIRFFWVYLKIIFFRKPNSLIVFQKIVTNRLYGKALKVLLRLRRKGTLYDLDDAEQYRVSDPQTYHFFLTNCETVQVGSEMLVEYASQFNKNVSLATSPVTNSTHQKEQRNMHLTVGWIGDFGNGNARSRDFAHKTSLYKLLFPALRHKTFPIKLILIGVKNDEDIPEIEAFFEDSPNVTVEIVKSNDWVNDQWVYQMISTFDVGVSPMVDHPFTRSKSAFKAKQYLSCGVPVIASNVGENSKFVHNGKNGYLCESVAEFAAAFDQFETMSPRDYSRFLANARKDRDTFSIGTYGENLIRSLKQISG